jgi:hypothetical protein
MKAVKFENWKMTIANRSRRRAMSKCDDRRDANSRHGGDKGCGQDNEPLVRTCCSRRDLHFSLFNFQFSLPSTVALCCLLFALPISTQAQNVPDKMVATVTNGSRATPDLITYSDLVWQLALEPARPTPDRPSSAELNHALRLLEDQLLILQEARKLPSADTAEGAAARDREVDVRRNELAQAFGGAQRLQERMARVGLTSEQLDLILRDRVMVDQYLDFRFRAFTVITEKEIQDRYNRTYAQLKNSGRIVPTLEEVRNRIKDELTEQKIEADIDKFIDDLREQPGTEIVVLNPV